MSASSDIRTRGLSLLIISGSTQKDGQSLKVAKYVRACLDQYAVESFLVDLHTLNLPFFGLHRKEASWRERWQAAQSNFERSQGVVLISPEYNGSLSPAVLNLMLYVDNSLAHKPVLTIGVSAGRGGAYPLAALRQNGFKDPAYVLIPQSVIVSHVNEVLNDRRSTGQDERFSEADNAIRQRIDESLNSLFAYAQALKDVSLFFKD